MTVEELEIYKGSKLAKVVALRIKGLKFKEIGKMLGVSEGYASARYRYAKRFVDKPYYEVYELPMTIHKILIASGFLVSQTF